jgi:hypothetical protein
MQNYRNDPKAECKVILPYSASSFAEAVPPK